MELKFVLLTLFVLFATFGSIESQRHSGSRSGSIRQPSRGRFNSSSALKPWATVPPPRRNGTYYPGNPTICNEPSWYIQAPCRPFGTVPPPTQHGGQHWNSHIYPHRAIYPYGSARRLNSNSPTFNRTLNNGTGETLHGPKFSHGNSSNSTSIYPSLSGLSESQNNVTVLNGTVRPNIPEYNGNSSSQNRPNFPLQIDPVWLRNPNNGTAGEIHGTVVNATGNPSVFQNHGNSSYQNGQPNPI